MKRLFFIAVLSCYLGITSFSNAQLFDKMSNPQIAVKIVHPPGLGMKIDKVAFNTATGNCADQIIDVIISDFVKNKIEVVDRANLTAILAEHNLNFSGYVDAKNAVAIGKIIGPSALVTVKVLRCETKVQGDLYKMVSQFEYPSMREYQVRQNIARTSAFLKVSIQTADLTTGRIFTSRVLESNPVRENASLTGTPEAPSEFNVQEEAFNSLTNEVHRMFFPWTEMTTLYYFDDKEGGLKQAFQALKAGDEAGSFTLSSQNLETCKQTTDIKPKILAHAYYNMGMSYFIRSEFDKALENLEESRKLRPGEIVTNSILSCRIAKRLMSEMQMVDEKAAIDSQKAQTESENAQKTQEANTLKNEDIVTLTQKKLPNSIIIQKIKTSYCKFDTSTDAMINLTNAGVSEDVIIEMMNKK